MLGTWRQLGTPAPPLTPLPIPAISRFIVAE